MQTLGKAKEMLKLTKRLYLNKLNMYNKTKENDHGHFRDTHEKIETLRKEVSVLENTFAYWSLRVNMLESGMNIQ